MINLVQNELKKIFHKKAIYIVLALTVVFAILNIVITKLTENSVDNVSSDVEFYREQVKEIENGKIEDENYYLSMKAELQLAELLQKYESNSWQAYIINTKGHDLLANMFYNEGKADYEGYKKQLDQLIKKLESGDWKQFAKEEQSEADKQIKELNEQKQVVQDIASLNSIDEQIQSLTNKKQALQWRIEKNIPYGMSNKNSILDQWGMNKENLYLFKEAEKTKKVSYSDRYDNQNTLEIVALSEYDIKEELKDNINLINFNGRTNLASSADADLIQTFESYGLFILIAIVIVAGTSISEEFNKGTIKLLLVRPYKRTKILAAKFISCIAIFCLVYVFMAVLQFIVGGLANGFENYVGKVFIYSFKTNSVEMISTFKYLVLTGASILPRYILLMTFAFSLSVIFVNSPIAIALPLIGMMGSEIINEIAYNVEKAKFLRFFVTPNWNLIMYQFGKLPEFEHISLGFSIVICLVYFVIMGITSMAIFKNKEIKNI